MWIVESEPDASHRIRVDANIKYGVPADRDSCGRFVEDKNTRESLFFFLNFDKVFKNFTPEKIANM